MSRVGKLPIVLSEKVEATLDWNKVVVKWPLWTLSFEYSNWVEVSKDGNSLVVKPLWIDSSALWWTTRAILSNMVEGVVNWFKKSLEINWVWYKFEVVSPQKLVLSIWFSHKVEMDAPAWIKVAMDEKEKNVIHITWVDKQLVWEFASKVRAKKKPEPYKWKWIKYVWEQIRRKAWKTGK